MYKSMRRLDRQVTSMERIETCLKDSECLHVGFNDNGEVYIVPVNFGYILNGEKLQLYFHGAKQGRKMEIARVNPQVGFSMETHLQTVPGKKACDYSELFLSISFGIV